MRVANKARKRSPCGMRGIVWSGARWGDRYCATRAATEDALDIMKLVLPGQAFFRCFYPSYRSHILPETVEAPAKESFLVHQHSRISILGCAEALHASVQVHEVEDPRLQNLNAGEHELCRGP